MPLNIVDGASLKVAGIITTIYGPPGVGKTTLAMTAARPVLLDFDRGAHRAAGRAGKSIAPVSSWGDIVGLKADDLEDYDTIIVDTVGTMLDSMAASIIANDAKMGVGGNLSLQGYGRLKTQFAAWLGYLRSLGKDIVIIAHCTEARQPDGSMVDRIKAVGSSRDEVYQQSDLIGRIAVEGGQRVLSFDPTEHSYAKNCGLPKVPVLDPAEQPELLAQIITSAKDMMGGVDETAEWRRLAARVQADGYFLVAEIPERLLGGEGQTRDTWGGAGKTVADAHAEYDAYVAERQAGEPEPESEPSIDASHAPAFAWDALLAWATRYNGDADDIDDVLKMPWDEWVKLIGDPAQALDRAKVAISLAWDIDDPMTVQAEAE